MFFLTVKTYRYTFLWRAAGSPEAVSNTCIFTDVAADAYYVKAVQWAYEQGITAGTSATRSLYPRTDGDLPVSLLCKITRCCCHDCSGD